MIESDEDALICDLAETYSIFNYKELPVYQVAVYAYGLRADSRIRMKISNSNINLSEMLLASTVDKLNLLVWTKTEDGSKNRNRPKSILEILNNNVLEKEIVAYETGDKFIQARNKLINGGEEI